MIRIRVETSHSSRRRHENRAWSWWYEPNRKSGASPSTPSATFALRHDFGSWSLKHPEISEWVVSVQRRSPYRGPLFGLFDPTADLRLIGVDGLAPDFLFGPYHRDQARFSCIVQDEWDVATLMRIMGHES